MPDVALADGCRAGDSARVKRIAVLALVLAAGCDSDLGEGTPALGCSLLDHVASFESGAEFAHADPGTLAGWNPDGRWFIVGAPQIGAGSVLLQRSGGDLIVDRNTA